MEIIKYFKDYVDAINEGLIKTHDLNKISYDIYRSLSLLNFDVSVDNNVNKFTININNFNKISENKIKLMLDHIMVSVVNRGGWFPSYMNLINIDYKEKLTKFNLKYLIKKQQSLFKVSIIFESKFGDIIYDVPDKLYHLSIQEYDEKIKKIGLIPKSKSKLTSHIDRIYLCKTVDDCKSLINQMLLYYEDEKSKNVFDIGKEKYQKNTNPIIYEIDNSDKIINKLYDDINYENGYYTTTNIYPEYIREIWRK